MIQYRSGRWGLFYALSLRGSVFPKALVAAGPCAAFAALLNIFMPEDELTDGAGDGGTNVLGGFTFVLGFLIVFRSQAAYSRWWEGATLLMQLRGEWLNAFSSCMAFCTNDPEAQEDVARFQHKLVRLMSLLHGAALSEVSEMRDHTLEFVELESFDPDSLEFMKGAVCKCEIVLQWVQRLIVEAHEVDILKVPSPILSRVFNQLGNGVVILTNAQKLNDFPVPFPLAQMITLMLVIHWFLTAVFVAAVMSHPTWAAIATFVIIFAYWGIHYIALELEQPFGDDLNDVPMQDLQADMNTGLLELVHPRARSAPATISYRPDQHGQIELKRVSLSGYIAEIQHSPLRPSTKHRPPRRRTRLQPWEATGEQRLSSFEKESCLTRGSIAFSSFPGDNAGAAFDRGSATCQAPGSKGDCLQGRLAGKGVLDRSEGKGVRDRSASKAGLDQACHDVGAKCSPRNNRRDLDERFNIFPMSL